MPKEAIPLARDRHGNIIAYFTISDMTVWEAEKPNTTKKIVEQQCRPIHGHCDVHNEQEIERIYLQQLALTVN